MDKFYVATKTGDVDTLVGCIIENHEFVNNFTTEDGKTALHVAIEEGNLNIVEILLWNGADPIIVDASGSDCLRSAQLFNQTECLNLIISHEIRNKSLFQSCYDIILKGCPHWFTEFIKFKLNNEESELNLFTSVEQSYYELLTKNIKLSNEMKGNVEIFLIDNNYKKPKWGDNLLECYKNTKVDLLRVCDELKPSFNTELFILKLKMFLKHSSVLQILHSRLKYSGENLCWTQIDFLIGLFINIRERPQQINFIYKNLDKKLIISYIKLFVDDLNNSETSKNTVDLLQKVPKKKGKNSNKKDLTDISKIPNETKENKKLIPKELRIKTNKLKQAESKINPKLKRANKIRNGLRKIYNHLKNITTIERIIDKIQTALCINIREDGITGVYVIRRALQIIGEGVKSTDSSLNISKSTVRSIKNVAPKSLIDITTNLRDVLSHGALFRYSESLSFEDLRKYWRLQNELKKMINFLIDLLYRERCYALKVFFHKIYKCKDSNEMIKLKKIFPFEKNIFSEKYYLQFDQISEKWKKISSEFIDPNDEKFYYVKEIEKYLEKINAKLGEEVFIEHFVIFDKINRFPLKGYETIIRNYCLSHLQKLSKQSILFNINGLRTNIYANICKLRNLLETEEHKPKYWNEFNEVADLIFIDHNNPLKTINALKFNLKYISLFEIEEKITILFSNLLKNIKNRENIDKEIERHKNIYFGKKKMIEFISKNPISQENCNELENMAKSVGIDFKNVKMNYLKGDKLKASKNIENMTSIYGKLVKDMKLYLEGPLKFKLQKQAIEKFFESNEFKMNSNDDKKWLKNILQNHQNYSDQKVMQYLLKLKTDLCHLFPLNILTDEKTIAEEYAKYKENNKLQSAVETILFEICQIIFEDDDKSEQDHSSMLTGRDLRNYLAHGSLFFSIFTIDPMYIIFLTAFKLVRICDDSDFNLNDFKSNLEIQIKSIYKIRSSLINNRENINYKYEIIDLNNVEEKLECNHKRSDMFSAIASNNLEIVKKLCKQGINVNEYNNLKTSNLFIACSFGHLNIVIELLKYAADINLCDPNGENSLVRAIWYGQTKITEYLLEYLSTKPESYLNKTFNCVNDDGVHILHAAIGRAPIKIIKMLISMRQIDLNKMYNESTFLHYACIVGKRSVVKLLISENVNINIKDNFGKTPIFYAVTSGHIKITKILLKKCPNLNGLLHKATVVNNLNILKLLIKNNADINETDEIGCNILHNSFALGHSEISIYLIENKFFDLNYRMIGGRTYFQLAAGGTSTNVIDALIKNYETKVNWNTIDDFGQTPLQLALIFNNSAMIKYLVTNGADISLLPYLSIAICSSLDEKIIPLLECGANVNEIYVTGNTPLHIAIEMGNHFIAKILVDYGADIEVYGLNKLNPLMKAAIHNHYEIVLMLLQAGAQVTLENLFDWMKIRTIECENIDMIKLLIQNNAVVPSCWDVEFTNVILYDVLYNLKVIHDLIENKTDLFSPLHLAIKNDDLDKVKLFASFKEYINSATNDNNLTPVLLSVVLNKVEYLKILIDCGADVNSRYCQSETPLIFATELRNYEMVEILLKAGAEVNAKTIKGRPSLFYAAQANQTEIVKLLIQYGGKIDKIMCMSLINFKILNIINNTIFKIKCM